MTLTKSCWIFLPILDTSDFIRTFEFSILNFNLLRLICCANRPVLVILVDFKLSTKPKGSFRDFLHAVSSTIHKLKPQPTLFETTYPRSLCTKKLV